VSERGKELLQFYRRRRIDDQLGFYTSRREQFELASGQALAVSAMLLGFASAASALAGTGLSSAPVWSALATILPATSSALIAYASMYAFEQQSKIYGDAVRSVHAASRFPSQPDASDGAQPSDGEIAELVKRVEGVLQQEQGQWGQLTSQLRLAEDTKGG
jgi:type IV secretory pathway VirB6-like protein